MNIYNKEILEITDIQELNKQILSADSVSREFLKQSVIDDQRIFNHLYRLVYSSDHKLSWHSCWIIDNASEKFPSLLESNIPELISGFLTTNRTCMKRHFARILCRYQIPEEYLGEVVDRCYHLLLPSEPAAVRVFSMQLLFNIAQEINDLKGELISVLENLVDEGGTTGFLNRAQKILSQLKA